MDLSIRLANLCEFQAIEYVINHWLTNLANAILQEAPEVIKTRGIDALLMVAIAIASDQTGIAAQIAWTRREAVLLEKVSVENLRRAIEQVLRREFYKKNALELQESIKQARGVEKAINIVEQAVVKNPF